MSRKKQTGPKWPKGTEPECCACGKPHAEYGYAGRFYCTHHAPEVVVEKHEEERALLMIEEIFG